MAATTKTTAARPPELMAWDTEFWGVRVGRAEGTPADAVSQWAIENTVGLMCLLIDADRPDEIQAAEDRGFRLTDVRVTLARQAAQQHSTVRMYRLADVPILAQIAHSSHGITRFYADPRLPAERCDQLYERWLVESCNGWADRVFVATAEKQPVGYVTIHLGDDSASIGLIAVDDRFRCRGLGTQLVRGAIDFADWSGRSQITVVTQGRNISAQRLFQSCGFRTTNTSVWLHKWFDAAAAGSGS